MIEHIFPDPARRLSDDQRRILEHADSPAWVSAGPGSGKTDTLALFALRLLYVRAEPFQAEPVAPESIIVTTFTEKAARNLEDRISRYRSRLIDALPEIAQLDVSRVRVGTLHGLCNDLLQEARAASYENVRLMDKFESELFIYDALADFVRSENDRTKVTFWMDFSYLIPRHLWNATYGSPPRWLASRALGKLFNRIVEGRASLNAIRAAGGSWAQLADLYERYARLLVESHRCDFAHLQARFLDFMRSPESAHLREGDENGAPVSWVLVDEYQDTNLLQEEIYAALASRPPHNLIVVGDDDQALYRFRGASVECMVTFDAACTAWLGVPAEGVRKYALADNFRSHERIVTFCNAYIRAFPSMQAPGARVPDKPILVARSDVVGEHPAIGKIEAGNLTATATAFAQTVRDLLANRVIEDYSQCCLLLQSTKEGRQSAGPYIDALRALGVPYYNPRNRAFLKQEEVLAILGAIVTLTDPDGTGIPTARELRVLITSARQHYDLVANAHPALREYVDGAVANLARHAGAYLPTELQELVYLLLALEPFDGWIANDVERRSRLAQVTALIEQYASLPVSANDRARRGRMRAADAARGVKIEWNRTFYNAFFGYLAAEGINEREDEDVIVPRGRVPIMTIHQAKGLEFPFVFVGHMLAKSDPDDEVYRIEDAFVPFTANAQRRFDLADAATRAELDVIRQFFVAYSRAQYALILVGMRAHFTSGGIPCGPERPWLKYQNVVAL
jgi:DNA helicase-2/ATP-dependent DNA helicase PcrA